MISPDQSIVDFIGLPDACCPLFAKVLSSEDFRKTLDVAIELILATRQKEKVVYLSSSGKVYQIHYCPFCGKLISWS